MANYIDEEILCEAYTRLNIGIYNDQEALAKLKAHLLPYFEERAKFLLGEEIRVEIVFEEGSLITRLRVLGSAGLILLTAVSAYGSFRQSVDQLSKDAADLAQGANLEVLFRTKTPYCDRVNIEKRKGVFGRVDNLIDDLDTIKSAIEGKVAPPRNLPALEDYTITIDSLVTWNSKAAKLFDKLESPKTESCIANGLIEELNGLPKELEWEKNISDSSFRSHLSRSDPDFAGQLGGVTARYKQTLASIKKGLITRRDIAQVDAEKKEQFAIESTLMLRSVPRLLGD